MTIQVLIDFLQTTTDDIKDNVLSKVHDVLVLHLELHSNLNSAFPYSHKLRVGIINNCLAIGYIGPNNDRMDDFISEGVYNENLDVYDFLGLEIKHLKATNPLKLNIRNIADKNINKNSLADKMGLEYLRKVDNEFSFTIIPDTIFQSIL